MKDVITYEDYIDVIINSFGNYTASCRKEDTNYIEKVEFYNTYHNVSWYDGSTTYF
jgi:hypothetical protein